MNRLSYILLGVFALTLVVGALFVFGIFGGSDESLLPQDRPEPSLSTSTQSEPATSTTPFVATTTIGQSVQERSITAFTFNQTAQQSTSSQHLLFVGGVHGGYEWNSVALAWQFIDYLRANPNFVPDDITLSVIPSANPDGVYQVTGTTGKITKADVPASANPGGPQRSNANSVDLNRNFNCNWEPESFWRGQPIDAGKDAFSEPETQALRDFITTRDISAVISWHSKANAVYASQCNDGILPQTLDIMNTYAQAAGYRAKRSFDAYPITGDMEGWLAKLGIPAVTVEMATHENVEWQRNLAGVKAVLDQYSSTTQSVQ